MEKSPVDLFSTHLWELQNAADENQVNLTWIPTNPLVFWKKWEYLRSPAKKLLFFAGYLADWQWTVTIRWLIPISSRIFPQHVFFLPFIRRWVSTKNGEKRFRVKVWFFLPEAIIQIRSTWWLIPRIVSGLVHPSYPLLIPCKSLGWTNPLTIRG